MINIDSRFSKRNKLKEWTISMLSAARRESWLKARTLEHLLVRSDWAVQWV